MLWREAVAGRVAPARACLELFTPPPEADLWELRFSLQAEADPSLRVPASAVWAVGDRGLQMGEVAVAIPSELFLEGMGRALTVFEPIARGIDAATPEAMQLTPAEAFVLVRTAASRLRDVGVGVVLPASLSGGLASRLGLAITAELRCSPWWRQLRQRGALVLVGPGHNGGDGLVVARELQLAGIAVRIWSPFERHKPLTAAHLGHGRWLGIPLLQEALDPADGALWIDGLFGIGQRQGTEKTKHYRENTDKHPMYDFVIANRLHEHLKRRHWGFESCFVADMFGPYTDVNCNGGLAFRHFLQHQWGSSPFLHPTTKTVFHELAHLQHAVTRGCQLHASRARPCSHVCLRHDGL